MNGKFFNSLFKAAILSVACLAFVPAESEAVGPVTSRLKKVLFYFKGYQPGDHNNTPYYARYVMQLGAANGFVVDTTQDPSVFTQANLATYDVLFLFSAYYFGNGMTTNQKTAVENWQAQSKGIACFHQCVRNQWGGTAPNWYDRMMGVEYQTYAGFGTGPVYVDSSVVGTDLGKSSAGTFYPANYRISWEDEWYTYKTNVRNLPNTKVILTTLRSQHPSNWGFVAAVGENHPMAWAREAEGGRFVLSSFFHRCQPIYGTMFGSSLSMGNQCNASSPRPDSLAKFIDGHYLGILKYLAGYTGCKDSSSANYNPLATVNDPSVCNASGIKIANNDGRKEMKIGDFKVSISLKGKHVVEVFSVAGERVATYRGAGPREYRFPQIRSAGMYYVKVKTATGTQSKKLFLL